MLLLSITNGRENLTMHNKTGLSVILTFILIIFVIQCSFCLFLGVTKNITLAGKIAKVTKLYAGAEMQNTELKSKMAGFNSARNFESLARNNLKMAAKNEALVVITDTDAKKEMEKNAQKTLFKKIKNNKYN